MKKFILAIAMIAGVCSANAQTNLVGSKLTDNWSIGVQGGVYEPTIGQNMIKDMRGAFNIDIQKQITPIFGLGVSYLGGINANNANEMSYVFTDDIFPAKTALDFHNLSANGLINLMNLFGGYKGEPRLFEVVARAGMGWGYAYGECYPYEDPRSVVTANFGADFNFNLGKDKAWQINLKPGITYCIPGGESKLDVRCSHLTLLAGITYKFKNSNGTHNFALNKAIYSQEQMDEMNNQINSLRAQKDSEIANKNKTIENLQSALAAEKAKEKTTIINNTTNTTKLAPVVIFGQGKSTVDASQKPSVAMIATYMKNHPESKVRIQGYASPEGNAELNQKLSTNRAQSVADMLTKTYGISSDRITVKGMGVTDELFTEYDWNRVATFIETNPVTTTTTTTKK